MVATGFTYQAWAHSQGDPAPGCPFAKDGELLDMPECDRRHDVAMDTVGSNIDKWFASRYVQQMDARTLPRQAAYNEGEGMGHDLRSAIRAADVAVLGTVEALAGDSYVGTDFRFGVERVAKGRAPAELTLVQRGQPEPHGYPYRPEIAFPTGTEPATLMIVEGAEYLLPGDRAVLLLRHRDATVKVSAAAYEVPPGTGALPSHRGRIAVDRIGPVRSTNGWTEDRLMDYIQRVAGPRQTAH